MYGLQTASGKDPAASVFQLVVDGSYFVKLELDKGARTWTDDVTEA
jgi:hypothetical protein